MTDRPREIVAFLLRSLPSTYRAIAVPGDRFEPGVLELLIIRNDGWLASLWIKAAGGRFSPEQVQWMDWLSAGGASQAVVCSIAEAEQTLRAVGVPSRGGASA